jgi:hypothetical protein
MKPSLPSGSPFIGSIPLVPPDVVNDAGQWLTKPFNGLAYCLVPEHRGSGKGRSELPPANLKRRWILLPESVI